MVRKNNDGGDDWWKLGIVAVAAGLTGGGLVYLATRPRIEKLEQEIALLRNQLYTALQQIDTLDLRVARQGESLKSFREYVTMIERRITNLEGNLDEIIRELEKLKIDLEEKNLNTVDTEKVVKTLINMAKKKKAEQDVVFASDASYIQ